MDVRAIGNSRVTAAPQRSASVDALPGLDAFQRVAWFDLNRDGRIDNVSTMYGGDAYLNPPTDPATVDAQLADRISRTAPSQPHGATRPVTAHQLARARATYQAHAAAATH